MTDAKLDLAVAKAVGIIQSGDIVDRSGFSNDSCRSRHHWPSCDQGCELTGRPYIRVWNDRLILMPGGVKESGRTWAPATDWSDAMEAAKLVLASPLRMKFLSVLCGEKTRVGPLPRWGDGLFIHLTEIGPRAICEAIMAAKGE